MKKTLHALRQAARRALAIFTRAGLAMRYCRCLGYSWHLAWVKAERAEPPVRMSASLHHLPAGQARSGQ